MINLPQAFLEVLDALRNLADYSEPAVGSYSEKYAQAQNQAYYLLLTYEPWAEQYLRKADDAAFVESAKAMLERHGETLRRLSDIDTKETN